MSFDPWQRSLFPYLSAQRTQKEKISLQAGKVYVLTGENDAKTLRVDANSFENGEKMLRFQTNTDTCELSVILRVLSIYIIALGNRLKNPTPPATGPGMCLLFVESKRWLSFR